MLELLFFIEASISTFLLSYFKLGYDGGIYILYYVLLFIGFYICAFLLFAAIFGLVGKTFSLNKEYHKPNKFYRFTMNCVMAFVLRALHTKVKVTGKENLPNEPFLLVQNHRHGLDPLIAVTKIYPKHKMAFISKAENMKIPFAGRFMWRCCYQSLDREDPRQAIKVINESARLIKEENTSVGVYPEGTRNKTNETLLEFKDGCLKVALRAKCPIVITTLHNSSSIGKNLIKGSKVEYRILKTLSYEQIAGKKTFEIGQMIKEVMLADLEK